ncbi:hypothetical protein CsSME_00032926 [Camellia sinensis var. sinensis]
MPRNHSDAREVLVEEEVIDDDSNLLSFHSERPRRDHALKIYKDHVNQITKHDDLIKWPFTSKFIPDPIVDWSKPPIFYDDPLAQLYPSFAEEATPFFTLNWSKYAKFLTFRGGLDPVTGGLWLTDIAHHHLAIAILFLIAGHMYRTNWGIGHGLKDILEAHKRSIYRLGP